MASYGRVQLLDGEAPGATFVSAGNSGEEIVLTNKRLLQFKGKGKNAQSTSFGLERIDSISVQSTANQALLFVGIALAIIGSFLLFLARLTGDFFEVGGWVLVAVGVILLVAYFLSLSRTLSVHSSRSEIQASASGRATESLLSLINEIEAARQARVEELSLAHTQESDHRDLDTVANQNGDNIGARLDRLHILLNEGQIDEEEFDQEKRRILNDA